MSKFRKKPVIVEAVRFIPYSPYVPDCVCGPLAKSDGNGKNYNAWFIATLEGYMEVNPGDWIITGVNGEKYPCKPDIFEKTYEAVE